MLAVSSDGRRGGLAMFCKAEVVLDTKTYSPHHIDAQVLPPLGQSWRLTSVYGCLEEQLKPETWRLLRYLHSRSTLLWMCIRDYNEILNSDEKNGGLPKPLPPPCWISKVPCSIADWLTLATVGIGLHGGMDELRKHLWRRGWIRHVHWLNGQRCIRGQRWSIWQHLTQIMT